MALEIELRALIPVDADYERVFDALADLVHAGEIPGVEIMCSGQGSTRIFVAHVFIDDAYDPKWDAGTVSEAP